MPASSLPRSSDPEAAERLREALDLAARGRHTSPNPRVGAVVVAPDGRTAGRGFHAAAGEPHAERLALAEAGERARGGTLYVSLEPCVHSGRTPPCVEAVLGAGVRRVVASHRDPNPLVDGRGFERLRAARIEVEYGLLVEEAVELNLAFVLFHVLGRPAVTLKWAMSADGKIATAAGESRWISSPAARQWALGLREEHDAILVGSGTVLADDPRLDRRLGLARGPILRVVLDRRLRVGPDRRLFEVAGPVLVYTETGDAQREDALAARGAEVVRLPSVAPTAVAADLAARGVQSLLVEGGGAVHGAFVAARLVDRVTTAWAPKLVGGSAAPGPVGGTGFASLAQAVVLERVECQPIDGDLVITALRQGCLRELCARVAA